MGYSIRQNFNIGNIMGDLILFLKTIQREGNIIEKKRKKEKEKKRSSYLDEDWPLNNFN